MTYPAWICADCGARWGRRECREATWHPDTCGVCGLETLVTEPRDYGHLREEVAAEGGQGMNEALQVVRYSVLCPITFSPSGDFLRLGLIELGEFRDIIEAEYRRAAAERPDNPASAMRPMFYTGSPFGAEILALARRVRPWLAEAAP